MSYRSWTGRMLLALWLVASFSFAACEPTDTELGKDGEDQGSVAEFLTAEDFDNVIVSAVVLCLEGVVEAEFTEPNQMFGFPFDATAGMTVWAGTEGDATFDTVVMLFGPDDGTGYYGRFPVALDDDSGEGLLSSMEEYEIKEDGGYVLVVGTYGGAYRGTVRMRVAVNGADGCGGEPAHEQVCCLMPPVPEPYPCWDDAGVPFDEDGDGMPDDCTDPAFLPEEEMFVADLEECLAMGGEPMDLDMCESQPLPEEICCVLAWRADDPDCWDDETGENRCGGEAERFVASADECAEMGGIIEPLEMCYDEPYPEEICCAVVYEDGVREMFIAPMEECEMMGGEFLPVDMCTDEPYPEEVCCLYPSPDGLEEMFIAGAEECMAMGGVPLPVEECREPEPEEVCCVVYRDWDTDPDCYGPEGENWCGEPEPYVTTAEECAELGGEFLPMEECGQPLPEEVCCVLYLNIDDPSCWDENGDGIPDCGEAERFIVPADECVARGGEVFPLEMCEEEPQPAEEVCCFFFDAAGNFRSTIMAEERCLASGGEPAPVEECEVIIEEVCCFLFDDAGLVRQEVLPEPDCLDMGGEPAPLDECREPNPEEVCCMLFLDGDECDGLDENGDGIIDCGPAEPYITSADACVERGGEVLPIEECRDPQPVEEVCCFFVSADGQELTEILPADICRERGGEMAPVEECGGQPDPTREVCCFVILDDGTFRTSWMAEAVCADMAGVIADEELCDALE